MVEVYGFIKNKKTKTIHIIKALADSQGNILERKLLFNHKSMDIFDLKDYLIIQEIDNFGNRIYWTSIEDARLTAAQLANRNHNVCANCVRELYKNEYPDID